jgi:hypothetical protein
MCSAPTLAFAVVLAFGCAAATLALAGVLAFAGVFFFFALAGCFVAIGVGGFILVPTRLRKSKDPDHTQAVRAATIVLTQLEASKKIACASYERLSGADGTRMVPRDRSSLEESSERFSLY